jgi:hypothetical protein
MKAAELRLKTLDTLQAVLLSPNLTKDDLQYIHDMLKEQLNNWTADKEMWIGDRASGMKVYNMIMQYGLDKGLEPDEIEKLQKRGIYDIVNKNLLKKTTPDEIFYLQAMRTIIDEAQRPFYKRVTALNQIEDQLRLKYGTEDEPYIAEFLLRGVADMMQYCALDRTRCETAFLAVEASLGDTASITTETIYGNDYEIKKTKTEVIVTYPRNLKPFRAPVLK